MTTHDSKNQDRSQGHELYPAYFETHFYTPTLPEVWPSRFAIITAYATTGERWTDAENQAADQRLRLELETLPWIQRMTGYSPSTRHAEPGWAAVVDFEAACDLGLRFRQDAIYFVEQDRLYVSKCTPSQRTPVLVGAFSQRVSITPSSHVD